MLPSIAAAAGSCFTRLWVCMVYFKLSSGRFKKVTIAEEAGNGCQASNAGGSVVGLGVFFETVVAVRGQPRNM